MLTIKQASEKTGVKIRTIRSWIEKKQIRALKDEKSKRLYIFDEEIEKMEGKVMAIRNFYLEADVDGYKTKLKGGPRSKDGGIEMVLYQRDNGEITTAFKISCFEKDGKLYSEVLNCDEETIDIFETER